MRWPMVWSDDLGYWRSIVSSEIGPRATYIWELSSMATKICGTLFSRRCALNLFCHRTIQYFSRLDNDFSIYFISMEIFMVTRVSCLGGSRRSLLCHSDNRICHLEGCRSSDLSSSTYHGHRWVSQLVPFCRFGIILSTGGSTCWYRLRQHKSREGIPGPRGTRWPPNNIPTCLRLDQSI